MSASLWGGHATPGRSSERACTSRSAHGGRHPSHRRLSLLLHEEKTNEGSSRCPCAYVPRASAPHPTCISVRDMVGQLSVIRLPPGCPQGLKPLAGRCCHVRPCACRRDPAQRWTMRQVLGCALFRHPVRSARGGQSTAQRGADQPSAFTAPHSSRILKTAP